MPKEIEEIPLVSLKVDFDSEVPLYKQLYNTFRQSILDGKFSPGQKLPGTRSLASELNVSRNTVALALKMKQRNCNIPSSNYSQSSRDQAGHQANRILCFSQLPLPVL